MDIIYSEKINIPEFSRFDDYFYYDRDEDFGLPSYYDKLERYDNIYKLFFQKIGDPKSILNQNKVAIIKEAIFLLGMTLWGYERIEKIELPNTIILSHFEKLIFNSHKKIDQEIIFCLKRLIKKFGEGLTDEWKQIFQIFSIILQRDKLDLSENSMKSILEILDTIKILIIESKFHGQVSQFSSLLDEVKICQNDTLLMLKSQLKLNNNVSFISNLESVIIENLVNSKSERVKNHIFEIIRMNYSSSYSKKQGLKKVVMENLIAKYFAQIIFSCESLDNFTFFCLLVTEILSSSYDLKYFEKLTKMILFIHNEYKFLSGQNQNDISKLIWNFQKNCLTMIYNKLNITYQPEKINILNKKIYQLTRTKCDISLLLTLISFFKTFTINKDCELYMGETQCYKNNILPSQMMINFKYSKIKKAKKIYENYQTRKISLYEPYTVFKHNKIFENLMNMINNEETNTFICEEILDFFGICLKKIYFFKAVNIGMLISLILEIEDLKKYCTRKRFVDLVIDILINSNFHISGKSLISGLGVGIAKGSSSSTTTPLPVLEISEESLKEKVIMFSLNSLKSFVNSLKVINNNYKRIVQNTTSTTVNKSPDISGYAKDKDNIKEITHFTLQTPAIFAGNTNSNNQIMSGIASPQDSFKISININSITETMDTNISFTQDKPSLSYGNLTYTPNAIGNPTNNLNGKMAVYYIKRLLGLIEFYFISLIGNPHSAGLSNSNKINNFYFPHSMQGSNSQLTTIMVSMKKMNELVTSLIDLIIEARNLIFFKQSLAVSFLNLIYTIKDLLFQFGDEIILKVIYITLMIGWPMHENELHKLFNESFNYKFKKFDLEKIRPAEKYLKKEYVNLLSDICCFYFVEKSAFSRALFSIFLQIFKNPTSIRESVFIELCKWSIHSKTNRDNIKAMYRGRIIPFSQVYLGKQCVLMIVPINTLSSELIIRNSISNINMTVDCNFENEMLLQGDPCDVLDRIINVDTTTNTMITKDKLEEEEKIIFLPSVMEDKREHEHEGMINMQANPEEMVNDVNIKYSERAKTVGSFSSIEEAKKKEEFYCRAKVDKYGSIYTNVSNTSNQLKFFQKPADEVNSFSPLMINNSNIIFQQLFTLFSDQNVNFQIIEQSSQLEEYIKSLDNTPVYFTFNCGVIYIPDKSSLSEYDIFTYESEVSKAYLKFISSLGNICSLSDNLHVYAGGLDRSGMNGKYMIYFQDHLFQLIFHVINLIRPDGYGNSQKPVSSSEGKNSQRDLHLIRKKIVGNDYINIIWLDNPYKDFDPNLIISGMILIYIVIYPISNTHFFIKLKYNKKSKFSLQEKISTYFLEECIISNDNNYSFLSNYLIKLVIKLNLIINYIIQKSAFKKLETDYLESNLGNLMNIQNQLNLETNITQRYKELERIYKRFKK